MARWLLDTDVLVDVALDRQPHSGPSGELLDRLLFHQESLFVAWHTVSNFHYNVKRQRDASFARAAVTDLANLVAVAPTGTADLHYALTLPMGDFEDAMQVAAARACDAEFIVTRNERDFAQAAIPTLTPADALARMSR